MSLPLEASLSWEEKHEKNGEKKGEKK